MNKIHNHHITKWDTFFWPWRERGEDSLSHLKSVLIQKDHHLPCDAHILLVPPQHIWTLGSPVVFHKVSLAGEGPPQIGFGDSVGLCDIFSSFLCFSLLSSFTAGVMGWCFLIGSPVSGASLSWALLSALCLVIHLLMIFKGWGPPPACCCCYAGS